ncbi:MAG: hypothetical protein RQ758_00830 [Methanomicrobiaceae archaeon]|nr:hypothetical protein [Methanomicrobiaceae archaeon]
MNAPSLKTRLYWCPSCNLPLLGQRCGCGSAIPDSLSDGLNT